MKAVAAQMKRTPVVVPTVWYELEKDLLANKFDAILSAWTPSPATPATIVASPAYCDWGLVVAVRAADDRVKAVADLGQQKLRVGHIDDPAVKRSLYALGGGRFEVRTTVPQLFSDLMDQKLDAVVYDSLYVRWRASRQHDVRVVGEPLNRLGYHLGLRKADAALCARWRPRCDRSARRESWSASRPAGKAASRDAGMRCPKCGFEQAAGTVCARCGVLFDRVRDRSATRPSPKVAPRQRSLLRRVSARLLRGTWVSPCWPCWPLPSGSGRAPPSPPLPAAPRAVGAKVLKRWRHGPGPGPRRPRYAPSSPRAPRCRPSRPAVQSQTRLSPSDFREVPPYWLTGATGYEDAVRRRQASSAPLVLYFFTDWCPYCKVVDRDLFSSTEVDRYFSRAVFRVRVNPEAGDAERRLAERYHVTGYPSFFVLPASSEESFACSLFREGRERKAASPQQLQDRIEGENLRNAQRLIREGYERRRAGDPAGAVALLDQAVTAAPRESDGWLQRAILREEQGALDGALADYGMVAVLRKDSVAHERAVHALLKAERFDEAVACATEWMGREPRALMPIRQRAWAHHQRGDEARAREDAQRCCILGDHAACAAAAPTGP